MESESFFFMDYSQFFHYRLFLYNFRTRAELDRYLEASQIRERAIERITDVIGTYDSFAVLSFFETSFIVLNGLRCHTFPVKCLYFSQDIYFFLEEIEYLFPLLVQIQWLTAQDIFQLSSFIPWRGIGSRFFDCYSLYGIGWCFWWPDDLVI